MKKKCNICNKTKKLEKFPVRSDNKKYRGECKKCTTKIARQYRKDNKYKLKLQAASNNYNITIEEAAELYKRTNCDICDKELKGRNKVIDHCHTTGKVRGVLCHKCNRGIGFLNDDIKLLNKATQYLKNQ